MENGDPRSSILYPLLLRLRASVSPWLILFLFLFRSAEARIHVVTLPGRDSAQLTIYNSADLTLVKETRFLTLRKGLNKLEFSWANTLIDPTSVEFRALTHADEVDVLDISFPPRVTNTLEWRLHSEFAGEVEVEIRYFTSGISWAADYVAEADEGEKLMALAGHVRVSNNSGEDYENAQVRLVVGVIRLVEEIADLARRGRPGPLSEISKRRGVLWMERDDLYSSLGAGVKLAEERPRAIVKEALSEYFLYTVEGRDTIPTGWSKRLPSFKTSGIPIVSYYRFEQAAVEPTAAWSNPPLSLQIRDVSLGDAIRLVTDLAGLRYRIAGNAVVVSPHGESGSDRKSAAEAPSAQTAQIESKLKSIVLPELRFQGADISQVLQFLVTESKRIDPEHAGINIEARGHALLRPSTGQVTRYYRFKNDKPSKLGNEPLPDGQVKAFRFVTADRLYAFVGRTNVKYIPINEVVELELGVDLEVMVKPTLMAWEKSDIRFDKDGNVAGWTTKENWKLEVQNAKSIDVVLDIRRSFPGDWSVKTDAKYEKVDANKIKFVLPLKSHEKQTFTYELTTRCGINATR